MCPAATLFSDAIKTCDHWYNVDCQKQHQSSQSAASHNVYVVHEDHVHIQTNANSHVNRRRQDPIPPPPTESPELEIPVSEEPEPTYFSPLDSRIRSRGQEDDESSTPKTESAFDMQSPVPRTDPSLVQEQQRPTTTSTTTTETPETSSTTKATTTKKWITFEPPVAESTTEAVTPHFEAALAADMNEASSGNNPQTFNSEGSSSAADFRTENWIESMPSTTTDSTSSSTMSDEERFTHRKPRGPARGVIGSMMEWAARRSNSQLGVNSATSATSIDELSRINERTRSLGPETSVQRGLDMRSPAGNNEIPDDTISAPYEFPYQNPDESSNSSSPTPSESVVVTNTANAIENPELENHGPWEFPMTNQTESRTPQSTLKPRQSLQLDSRQSVLNNKRVAKSSTFLTGEIIDGQCRCSLPEEHFFS
jgi:hypothetical protein